jgi:hypothetical protein
MVCAATARVSAETDFREATATAQNSNAPKCVTVRGTTAAVRTDVAGLKSVNAKMVSSVSAAKTTCAEAMDGGPRAGIMGAIANASHLGEASIAMFRGARWA